MFKERLDLIDSGQLEGCGCRSVEVIEEKRVEQSKRKIERIERRRGRGR